MFYKFQTFAAACLAMFVAAGGQLHAAPVNGGFEAGVFTTAWDTTGDTSVESAISFPGTPTSSGTFHALMTNDAPGSVTDTALESFLGLAAGALDALSTGNATEGSAIKQSITVASGDTLSFDWNFLTDEATPTSFNDMAFWSLTTLTGATLLADTFSSGFGLSGTTFGEETGYSTTSFTFSSSGTFMLGFGVVDVDDTIANSGLLIDSVSVTSPTNGPVIPEPASMVLFGLTSLGMMGWTTRRRRKSASVRPSAS